MKKQAHKSISTDSGNLLYTCINLVTKIVLVMIFLVSLWAILSIVSPGTSVEEFTPDWSRLNHNRITPPQRSAAVVENGIHLPSGLKEGPGRKQVQSFCLSCHSSKLITQNRATADGWESMIDWMQATQGLSSLGSNRKIIVDYLSTYYAPQDYSRREPIDLEETEWYILNIE